MQGGLAAGWAGDGNAAAGAGICFWRQPGAGLHKPPSSSGIGLARQALEICMGQTSYPAVEVGQHAEVDEVSVHVRWDMQLAGMCKQGHSSACYAPEASMLLRDPLLPPGGELNEPLPELSDSPPDSLLEEFLQQCSSRSRR